MSDDEIIVELTEMILMQAKEIKKLKERIRNIKQYIDVYEEYIQKEISDGDYDTSRNFREE